MPTILNESAPLERYSHNLTILAQQGAFAPLVGQEAVINRVFQVLQRKNKCNPLILATDETRRWAVVAEVTRRMAVGDAPDPFAGQQVIMLDYEALFTNRSDDALIRQERRKSILSPPVEKLARPDSDGEWTLLEELFRWPSLEECTAPTLALARLQTMFMAMQQAPGSFLLFVDHFHRLVGGEYERYPIDAFALLTPALARHQVQLIGACTVNQYRQHIERDAAIQCRCQEICLPEAYDNL
jgi:ATP-dependent Clp protease ATP-binding subunit ClpA